MLLFKRLSTSFILFLILFVILSVGTLAVIGGVVGARAASDQHATDFQSGYAAGQAAGREVGQKYRGTVFLFAFGMSAVASVSISFTGILPWCSKKSQRPPLPQV